jgi:hypothetical protein
MGSSSTPVGIAIARDKLGSDLDVQQIKETGWKFRCSSEDAHFVADIIFSRAGCTVAFLVFQWSADASAKFFSLMER